MPQEPVVELPQEILDAIYAGAKELYPRESFCCCGVKNAKMFIRITDLVLAPFATHEESSVHFNTWMLPGDFSLIGTVHSHPSGNIHPSHVDLNYFFGRILMIVGPPFEGTSCIAVYDSNGDKLQLQITSDSVENF
jgi:proteasome lid subunit RPN8/RPN11